MCVLYRWINVNYRRWLEVAKRSNRNENQQSQLLLQCVTGPTFQETRRKQEMDTKPLGEKKTKTTWLATGDEMPGIIREVEGWGPWNMALSWFGAKVFNSGSANELQGISEPRTLFLWAGFLAFRFENQMLKLRTTGFRLFRWPLCLGQCVFCTDRNILSWDVLKKTKPVTIKAKEVIIFLEKELPVLPSILAFLYRIRLPCP